ncbi:hypothetical protein CDD82_2289 [Ophiocordyceps australis]|uniref:Cytochrome b-c1 complex subunit 2, mitochondrial n=1 Tax=Ophiocordyceps australis TaxID=1399860 RepID=A0A2C5ZIP2_9HYPO|nr:hypothetical protein CDD82_2289 [Ophiocordyceps australis]
MLSRFALARNLHQVVRRSCSVHALQHRGFAAAASASAFDVSDVSGIKVASRDSHGPTTRLAVVSKAGTRYQPFPGLCVGLEEFAFKKTRRRTALRITRESELLGAQLAASHTREALLIEASFLRQDLPYFAELLAEVISMTNYTTYEFHEDVERVLDLKQAALNYDVPGLALDTAHAVAFHTGLGAPVYPMGSTPVKKYLNEEYIASYADVVYSKPNIAVVADGASVEHMAKWVGHFFSDVSASPRSGQTLKTEPSKYYGGEQRLNHAAGNSMVIAFPGSDINGSKPEMVVLAALLGGKSTIKWSPGFSLLSKAASETRGLSATSRNLGYSDAGLVVVQLSGTAEAVRQGAEHTAKAIKRIADGSISNEDVTRAIVNAKFDFLETAQLQGPSMLLAGSGILNGGKASELASLARAFESVTKDQLTTAAKSLLKDKATVSTVGDLFVLPFADDIGLRV